MLSHYQTNTVGVKLSSQAIITILNIKRVQPKADEQEVRKIHRVTGDQWQDEFNQDNIELTSNLEELVPSFNTELTHTHLAHWLQKWKPNYCLKLSILGTARS